MAIADQSILHDAVQKMKQVLASGIDDPLSRGGGGSMFILSAWPNKKIQYPVLLISANLGAGAKMGMDSEMHYFPINYVVDVVTTDTRVRDELTGSIVNLLRTHQYGDASALGSATVDERMYDFNVGPTTDFDEPGKGGLHRKIIPIYYKYYTSG